MSLLTTGVSTVYEQHVRAFGSDLIDPREKLLDDLLNFIHHRQQLGDLIILGMDTNHHIAGRRFTRFLGDANLKNAVFALHGSCGPATQLRNTQSTPIDGLFCSLAITPEAAGYSKTNIGIPSDHVQLWADFVTSDLTGNSTADLIPVVDPLNVHDPRLRDKYNFKAMQALSSFHIPAKLRLLQDISASQFTMEHQQQYNSLHHRNTAIRLAIKKSIRHVFRGAQPWSPKWAYTRQIHSFWYRLLQYRNRKKDRNSMGNPRALQLTKIRKKMRTLDLGTALTLSIPQIKENLLRAKADLTQVRNQASNLRHQHLLSVDQARASDQNNTEEKETRSRIQIERQRAQGRCLRQLKSTDRQLVDQVTFTVEGNTTCCTTQEDMQSALFLEGHRRFSQTNGDPPMQHGITTSMGFYAETAEAQQVLDGTFAIPLTIDKHLKWVLTSLCMPTSSRRAGVLPSSISLDEHRRGWKKQSPTTASVKSQLGFKDHISAAYHPELADMDRIFCQIPYTIGFSPLAYRHITDFQILKKQGDFAVESMRTIQLMVAAFNMNNKKTGREAMARA